MSETMRLYHFIPTKYALEDISKRRLKAAELATTNDPYELLTKLCRINGTGLRRERRQNIPDIESE